MRYYGTFIKLLPYIICTFFFLAYAVLSIVRHNHYQSFGYDLGINDQAVWRYSTFQAPVVTIAPFPDKTKLFYHVELIFALISPFYWIWSSSKMLLLLEPAFVCAGGIAIYLLARKKLKEIPSLAVLISYLSFYGVQNAIWFDVHSISFGAAFLAWFLYFIDADKKLPAAIFFLLAIFSKENVAFITFFVSAIYLIRKRDLFTALLSFSSGLYLFFIFFIYFPYIMHTPYLYQNAGGLVSNINPFSLFDTPDKIQTIIYSILSFGFIPFLFPVTLVPALADLSTYFIFGSDLSSAQGIFMQYRITLAPLLSWASILTIRKYGFLNNKYVGIYLIVCSLLVQYLLHLPLSYLAKRWFWQEPPGVKNIELVIKNYLPKNASVVSQNNILPHISERDKVYELYPEMRTFAKNSPCASTSCSWFRWYDHPEFLLVDVSPEWDARHLLTSNSNFVSGVRNMEKEGVIKVYKRVGSTTLYKIVGGTLQN